MRDPQLLDLPALNSPTASYYLFSYFEYVGDDFAADMANMAADPTTQKWWAVCKPCQEPLANRAGRRVVVGHGGGLPLRLTSRERVLTAFAHEEPDRVPTWCGASEEFWAKAKTELQA